LSGSVRGAPGDRGAYSMIPVLFPSPGKLAHDSFSIPGVAGLDETAGKSGKLKQHGFARTSAFSEVARGTGGAAWVLVELVDSEPTRSAFPFAFRLRLRFSLRGASLSIRAEVLNTGNAVLPFALGYHPYFAVAVDDKGATRIPTRATRAWNNVGKSEIAMGPLDLAGAEVDLHLYDLLGASLVLNQAIAEAKKKGHWPGEPWAKPSRR